jgi:flagellar protein FlaI
MLIPMMNAIALVDRTKIRDITVRRVLDVSEIIGVDDGTGRAKFLKVYEWDHVRDFFVFRLKSASDSFLFKKICELRHVDMSYLLSELDKREQILTWMVRKGVRSYEDVADVIRKYYVNPEEIYNRARFDS